MLIILFHVDMAGAMFVNKNRFLKYHTSKLNSLKLFIWPVARLRPPFVPF